MPRIDVALDRRSYPIHIGEGILSDASLLQPHLGSSRAVVISNEVVAPLYLDRLKASLGEHFAEAIVLPDGEAEKNLDTVSHIYDRLLRGRYDRKTTLIALGGGVVGDITGFAAATYLRGIPYIQIPTTLLAQVDSSVGGKTGVNHALGKNLIGAFYQPVCVLADTRVLDSLPERELKAGLAEVIKYGLIVDASFFDWLAEQSGALLALEADALARTIQTCCEIKARVVAQDERESGVRALLNLGHTFGHAIETASGYGRYLHGETVAMGMVMAADLSRRLDWLSHQDAARIRQVLEQDFGMPVLPPTEIDRERYWELMASDKKAEAGRVRFILLRAIGEAVIEGDVPPELVNETLTAGESLCKEPG